MLLTAGAIFAITQLVQRVDSSRRAQLAIRSLTDTVAHLEGAPYSADRAFNPNPIAPPSGLAAAVAAEIRADEAKLSSGLSAAARAGAPAGLVASGRRSLADARPVLAYVYELATKPGGLAASKPATIGAAQARLADPMRALSMVFAQIARADAARAEGARTRVVAGTVIAMLFLLAVFGYFYFRSERLGRENQNLLGLSREEATTDVLTGLGNRRALITALSGAVGSQDPSTPELLVAIFDLNGFKHYNDTFGHAAGDALLVRLGSRLSAAVLRSGSAYRMGGDEFCVIARCAPDLAEATLDAALAALSDSGEGWQVSCSQGAVWVPSEAASVSEALQIADVRMYANKTTRSSTRRQIADVLLQLLNEQDQALDMHVGHVAELSGEVARALHQPDHDVQLIRLAATLHDIGKTALPDSVLSKPGALSAQEWEFMRRHTLIGERIVLAAPALASTAPLVRSSHERLDGSGYPDGLRGEQIPLGSRIISVCDAFDAMTSKRPYREATSDEITMEELRRCAGSQFDREVVGTLCAIVTARTRASVPAQTTTD